MQSKLKSTRQPSATKKDTDQTAGIRLETIGSRVATIGLLLVLFGSAFAVDPLADASFDAPKLLCVILGSSIASLGLWWERPRVRFGEWSKAGKWSALLGAFCGLWLILATLLSAHPDIAWRALRHLFFFALLFSIGASQRLRRPVARRLFIAFAVACVANAMMSLWQAAGWQLPLNMTQAGGRFPTGALLGNEGYVALACALLAAACAGIIFSNARQRLRWNVAIIATLCVATIAVNRQATSALALIAMCAVLAAARWRVRWVSGCLTAMILLGALAAIVPGVRAVTWAILPGTSTENYQRLTTFRLGAWAAAIDMARSRPIVGYGPGTFAAEEFEHRLDAEIELRERLLQPTGASFVYAHNDYLQLAAEGGIPALLALLLALAMVLARLFKLAQASMDPEAMILLAMLGTGALSALAWFPMQIPFIAAALLLALGRAWRLTAEAQE